ncbi:MAG TPA: type II CAAX endopeptidase family protein [Pyrinomonadaceae bacterium]|jgi:membrane protease YdiL (CAAX protease family)|nr:type II CAAX endopeptidase family protein [Pyrinomonadaceae bacterium]
MPDFFYNKAGRLRSGWRLAVFTVALLAFSIALVLFVNFTLARSLSRDAYDVMFAEGGWGFVIQSTISFGVAALVAWGCGQILEDLPWRSLGWTRHRGWLRDAFVGLTIGGAAVCVAALVGAVAGGYRIAFGATVTYDLARTLAASGFIFLLGAAGEEMVFRGYPLQTLMRSWPILPALVFSSITFGLVHMGNPNVVPGFTLVNTALAGAWLAVAYWRTRSLWFPLGLHFGWNWVQGALLGSPVSGITRITPDPLLKFSDAGPEWIGGGAYGIEGGAACTLAIILGTLFVWRTRLLTATPELKHYTDGENPNPEQTPVVSRQE